MDMSEEKKSGIVSKLFDRIRNENKENLTPTAENSGRLGYGKGNIDQGRMKNAGVWDTCPVLDEQGKPIELDAGSEGEEPRK